MFPLVTVKADGSIDTQEVWIEFKTVYEGQGIDEDGSDDAESATPASKCDLTSWDFDVLNITDVRAYIYNSDDDVYDRTYRIGIWEYISDTNAGTRFGYIEFTSDDIIYPPQWKGATGQGPITITDNIFFIGVWAENDANSVEVIYSANEGSLKSITNEYGFGGDPFDETGTYSDRTYNIQFRGWGYKDNLTTYNQYYGDTENYTARRDINYTFPSGVNNRKIKITIPNEEYIKNITRSNGGAWDETLSESDYSIDEYNETHKILSVLNTPLSLYEGDYRIYTISYPYLYYLDGLYFENGTKTGNVNITVNLASGSEEYLVDGPKSYGFSEKPVQITWDLSGGGTRRIYAFYNSEIFYFFTPDDDYATYSFTIKDYTARIGVEDCYLESLRIVNGTEKLIERVKIWDTINVVPLLLTKGKVYSLQIRFEDGSVYRYPYFLPDIDPTPTLIVREVPFSSQTHYVGEDIKILATRPNATHLQLKYEDTSEQTISLEMEISYLNMTLAFSDNAVGEHDIQFDWYGAHNESDLIVDVEISHNLYGNCSYTAWTLGEKPDFQDPPDFDQIIGKGANNIISIGLIIGALLIGSRKSTVIGMFLADAISFIVIYIGMLSSPLGYGPSVFAFALIVFYALRGGT